MMELCKFFHMTVPNMGLCNCLNFEGLKLDHGLNLLVKPAVFHITVICSEGFSGIL